MLEFERRSDAPGKSAYNKAFALVIVITQLVIVVLALVAIKSVLIVANVMNAGSNKKWRRHSGGSKERRQ